MADITPEQQAQEEEIALGLLAFTVNGTVRHVPELKRGANRAWQARMREVFASLTGLSADTPDGLAAMADAELGLVLEYDAAHVLGDLEDATEREVDAIYNRLVSVSFPLASSPMAVGLAILRAAVSARASSPSSPSPSGTSAPTPSRTRSPSARPASSTARRRSA